MVQTQILNKIDDPRLTLHVVWTPVLQDDNYDAAVESQSLITDPRVTHYWDGEMALGTVYGENVKLPNGRDFAWDIYFAFGDGVVWRDNVPQPADFAHQLGMDERHLRNGAGLRKIVEKLLAELNSPSSRQ